MTESEQIQRIAMISQNLQSIRDTMDSNKVKEVRDEIMTEILLTQQIEYREKMKKLEAEKEKLEDNNWKKLHPGIPVYLRKIPPDQWEFFEPSLFGKAYEMVEEEDEEDEDEEIVPPAANQKNWGRLRYE